MQAVQQDQVQVNVSITAWSHPTPIQPKIWGVFTKDDIHNKINVIYEEIVLWRRSLFKLPSEAAGKKFISETTKWIEFWNQDGIELKDIALKVLMVMSALLLQKPTFKSTAKEHPQCLSRRLVQWELGKFDELLREASTIQAKLPTNLKGLNEERLPKIFAKLVLEEKINAAMRLLDQQGNRCVLLLSQGTINEVKRKQPETSEADTSLLIDGQPPFVDPCHVLTRIRRTHPDNMAVRYKHVLLNLCLRM